VERLHEAASISREALRGDAEPGLTYLFVASGSGRIEGDGFEAVELPARAVAAIPASASAFVVKNLGGLDLIRITPHWPVE
jgi:hypothetical protein